MAISMKWLKEEEDRLELSEARSLIDDEIIPEIMQLVLETDFDFEVEHQGRGDICCYIIEFADKEDFKKDLKAILLRQPTKTA